MSEISELISLLDERGVEWSNAPTWILRWRDSKNREAKAVGFSNGLLCSAYLTPEQAVEATLGRGEQPPYDELIEALRRDWGIEASWDGLRRFWYVGLTDEGVRKRDEREAENEKLRELVRDIWHDARLLDANGHIDGMRLGDSKAEDYRRRMEELGVEV